MMMQNENKFLGEDDFIRISHSLEMGRKVLNGSLYLDSKQIYCIVNDCISYCSTFGEMNEYLLKCIRVSLMARRLIEKHLPDCLEHLDWIEGDLKDFQYELNAQRN